MKSAFILMYFIVLWFPLFEIFIWISIKFEWMINKTEKGKLLIYSPPPPPPPKKNIYI